MPEHIRAGYQSVLRLHRIREVHKQHVQFTSQFESHQLHKLVAFSL